MKILGGEVAACERTVVLTCSLQTLAALIVAGMDAAVQKMVKGEAFIESSQQRLSEHCNFLMLPGFPPWSSCLGLPLPIVVAFEKYLLYGKKTIA